MTDRPDWLLAPLPAGVAGLFTARGGGCSAPPYDALNLAGHVGDDPGAVRANRDLLADRLGHGPVTFPRQVHGAAVAVVRDDAEPDPDALAAADAVVTAAPGRPVGVLVADCIPVLLADPVAGVVAAAHAGRRGLVAGVLAATVEAMTGLGAAARRTVAVLGPAIGGCCYEVPADLQAEVAAALPGSAARTRDGRPALDLPAGAAALLRGLGVGDVRAVGGCTRDDPRWYSYRRDGRTGRFAGVVVRDG